MRLRILSFFIAIIIFSAGRIYAQGLCDRGGGSFTLDKYEGCAPLTVKITNTVPNPIIVGYQAFYDGRSTNPANADITQYTYTIPGKFVFLQIGATSSGAFYACKDVRVYETRTIVAQYTSCGSGKITLALSEDAIFKEYDEILIDWGDGESFVWQKGSPLTMDHNYANVSSSPVVKLTGRYTGGKECSQGRTYNLAVTFQQAQLSEIQIKAVEMRGDGTLRLTYQGVTAIPTEIKYAANGATYTTAGSRSSGGVQPYDIKGLNIGQVYQLKLSSEDLCQGQSDSRVYSSMTLSGKSDEGKNVLTWNQYPDPADFAGYDLVKDGTVIKTFTSITDVTYTDEDVQCGSYAEYQIVAKIKDVTSTSSPVGVKTEISSPRPIEEASVSVLGDNLVLIKAKVPGSGSNSTYDLTIEKADAGSTTFKKIITLYNQNEYSDISVKTNEMSYCYRMSYQNSCGQKLPVSAPICTILLTKNLNTLSWTPELPILGGTTGYTVMQRGSSGTDDEIPVQLNTNYTVQLNAQSDLEYNFQIRANSTNGEFESFSNILNYKRSAGVFVPQAFSPNGDGYNDVLETKSTQLQSFNFSVLNRWGQVVFHSDDLAKNWDGTINGTNAPVGSYVYKMTFVDDINQTVEKSGTFMLLR
ncbi:T9SS type B sorting domain-containing protein [Dyadobacter pollutisoli]|uniref:Gliding motility-associated C-terminal domain-containing protein n=1 Tax=Dyadobacter pollutisoli TaxID=2910158 RepID=A0A9E8N7C6_9BACT|nr:gliding motility-associated C-terminal domain-containing protein [Dyadobacter pollutisoli]WAC11215.1 gliding motility-associated C-terminal domain-containing protein [Dyadobacter pollutisoli]